MAAAVGNDIARAWSQTIPGWRAGERGVTVGQEVGVAVVAAVAMAAAKEVEREQVAVEPAVATAVVTVVTVVVTVVTVVTVVVTVVTVVVTVVTEDSPKPARSMSCTCPWLDQRRSHPSKCYRQHTILGTRRQRHTLYSSNRCSGKVRQVVAARPLKTQKGPDQTVAVAGRGHAPSQPTQGWQSEKEWVAVGRQVGVAVAAAVAVAVAVAAEMVVGEAVGAAATAAMEAKVTVAREAATLGHIRHMNGWIPQRPAGGAAPISRNRSLFRGPTRGPCLAAQPAARPPSPCSV